MILLPLWEKVSAKPTDEGFLGARRATPHPTCFAGHPLPQGERESTAGKLATKFLPMTLAASHTLFWYFSYPTPLAPGGFRSA